MAIDPVVIQFAARGMSDVYRAFESIEQRMARAERVGSTVAVREANARVRTARNEVGERERAYAKVTQIHARTERAAAKASAIQAREAKKGSDAVVREARKEAREIERLEEFKMRVRIHSSEMAGRLAAQQARQEIAAAEHAARGRAQAGRRIGGVIGRGVGGAVSMGSMALGIGGGFFVADAARRQMSAEKQAALLVNSATVGGKAPEGATTANVLGQASVASKMYGVDKGELIGAVQNYVAKSSDFKGGMENMGFFAKLAQGSGAKLEDITGAAGILRAQNKDLSPSDMRQMLLDMTEQGKQGAVEIQDMAHLAGGLGSTRGLYAGNAAENQRKLVALAQLTRTESESPEEAATAVKDLGTEGLKGKHAAQLKAWGVKFNEHGQYQDVQQMIEASLKGSHGNLGALEGVFGARGSKVFDRLAPIYNTAGGGEGGLAAVRKEMAPIMNAHGTEAQLDQQVAEVMNTPAKKIETAMNRITESLSQSLEPALTHFANDTLPKLEPIFQSIIDKGGAFAAWFADNPIKGIGAIILAKVGADVVASGIGEHLKKILSELLRGGGGSPTPGTPGPGGGPGATLGGDLARAEIGVVVGAHVAAANNLVNAYSEGQTSGDEKSRELQAGIRKGTVTSGDIKAVEDDVDRRTGAGAIVKGIPAGLTAGLDTLLQQLHVVQPGQSIVGGPDAASRQKDLQEALAIKHHTDQFKKELDAMSAAAKATAKRLGAVPGVTSPAPGGPIGQGPR